MADTQAIRPWRSNVLTRHPQGLYLTQAVHGVTILWPDQGGPGPDYGTISS